MVSAARKRKRTVNSRKSAGQPVAFARAVILANESSPAAECLPIRFDNGTPVYRFRKQVIRCGSFTTSGGQPFQVTPATLRVWLSDFRRMKANSVPVPVPARHDDTSADGNRGFVVDMALSNGGGGLDAVIELYGHEAPKLAASNHVSIYAEPDWTDGDGNRYRWPIRHVALTPDPRITGLQKFIPLAASNGTANTPIARPVMAKRRVRLDSDNPMNVPGTGYGESPANDGTNEVESDPLDMILDAIEEESLPKIREAKDKPERVKLAKEMARKIDAALAIFEEELEEGEDEEEAGEEEEKEEKPEAHLSNEGDKWCAIQKNIAKRRKAGMSNAAIHPEFVRLSSENRTMKIEQLFKDRKITAHQRKELLAKFTGEGPVKLALSNMDAAATFDQTLAILASNQPRSPELSGAQVLDDPLKLDNAKTDAETESALKLMRQNLRIKDQA